MIKTRLLLSIAALLVAVNLFAQTRLGLHVTAEELAIWKERAQKGPYKSLSDISTNSPGDWDRILTNANAFLINPGAEKWSVLPSQTTCLSPSQEVYPNDKAINIRDAAFAYLVKGDTKYRDAVRSALLWQASEPSTNFANTKRWCTDELRDSGMAFWHALWMNRLFFAYDYIRSSLSQTDKDKIEKWFYDAAVYFQVRNIDYDFDKLFVDRDNGNYALTNYSKNAQINLLDNPGFYGGSKISRLAKWYNNRRMSMVHFIACVGIHKKDEAMIKTAKLFVKEVVKYSSFADGTLGEMERGSETGPETGWMYASSVVDHALSIADMLARRGDYELYKYTTSEGMFGTAGGSKSLLGLSTRLVSFMDGSFVKYCTANSANVGNSIYKIDGVHESKKLYYINDVWASQSNVYYRNNQLKASYMRIKDGMDPYPPSPASSGPFSAWGGGFGIFPGKLFMCGQLEGRVWPYPGSTAPTYSPAPEEGVKCSATGQIYRERWSNLPRGGISTIPLTKIPTITGMLTSFEAPKEPDDAFGARIRGYVCPPRTGNYVFWISADDMAELYLSTNDSPANKRKIAYQTAYSYAREWDKYSSQKSVSINLTAGKKYYIEVLHKQDGSNAHVEVGWQIPGGILEQPIPGHRLSPYVSAARLAGEDKAEVESLLTPEIQAYPNPIEDKLTVDLGQEQEGTITIAIYDQVGKLHYQEDKVMEGQSSFELNLPYGNMSPGVYLLNIQTAKSRKVIKLLKN